MNSEEKSRLADLLTDWYKQTHGISASGLEIFDIRGQENECVVYLTYEDDNDCVRRDRLTVTFNRVGVNGIEDLVVKE